MLDQVKPPAKQGLFRWAHQRRERAIERAHERRIYADLAAISKRFEPRFRESPDAGEFERVLQEYLTACRVPDVQLEALKSHKLRRHAWNRGVEVPPDWWEFDETAGRRYLSPTGRRELRTRLRQARTSAFREWVVAITPFVALLIGLIGVAIGLLAAWSLAR